MSFYSISFRVLQLFSIIFVTLLYYYIMYIGPVMQDSIYKVSKFGIPFQSMEVDCW